MSDPFVSHPAPALEQFITPEALNTAIALARAEDLGPLGLDVTSATFVPEDARCTATLTARQPGVLAGAALLEAIASHYDPALSVIHHALDGSALEPGAPIATLDGPTRAVLAMERVALNFATHLSGIATLTARFVAACAGTRARICDTRKTIPGLRHLQKYAVACGGGQNHRMGLFDAVLIKDNHLTGVPLADLPTTINNAGHRARQLNPALLFVMVEVDTLEQLDVVLTSEANLILLDNMSPAVLAEAVIRRNRVAPDIELEASGGVNLDTVAAIAQSGVDRISIGALTHSAPHLDLGLDRP